MRDAGAQDGASVPVYLGTPIERARAILRSKVDEFVPRSQLVNFRSVRQRDGGGSRSAGRGCSRRCALHRMHSQTSVLRPEPPDHLRPSPTDLISVNILIGCLCRNEIYYTNALLLLAWSIRVVILVAQIQLINTSLGMRSLPNAGSARDKGSGRIIDGRRLRGTRKSLHVQVQGFQGHGHRRGLRLQQVLALLADACQGARSQGVG